MNIYKIQHKKIQIGTLDELIAEYGIPLNVTYGEFNQFKVIYCITKVEEYNTDRGNNYTFVIGELYNPNGKRKVDKNGKSMQGFRICTTPYDNMWHIYSQPIFFSSTIYESI